MRILYLAAHLPAPLLRGYEVRAFHQLRILSRRHRITLLTYARRRPAPEAVAPLHGFCDEIVTVPLGVAGMAAGVSRGLFGNRPLQTAMYETPRMRRAVQDVLRQKRHDLVHVQMPRMAALVGGDVTVPRVVDLIDALSLNMARRRALDRGVTGWLAGLEARRLLRYERALCRTWDCALVATAADRRAIGDFPNLVVNSNAVDVARFPVHEGRRTPDAVVFTGNLGYFPNVDGVRWFASQVMPLVRVEVPEATLVIAGARPARAVKALAALGPHIRVLGPVPDLAPHIGRARVAVAPVRAGSGQPLKVLEAMACGTPVVATRRAVDGLDVDDERHLLVADTPALFAQHVVRLLRDAAAAERLAAAARRLVEESYDWEMPVRELDAIYESLVSPR